MSSWLAIILSLCLALILAILPMPEWFVWARPAWVLLVLIYWAIMAPFRVGIGAAWFMGLVMDMIDGTMLGEHALAYTIVVYLVSRMSIRLSMFPMLQQSLSIFIFVLLYQFMIFCIQGFVGEVPTSHWYWSSSLTSLLLWPWLFILLRDYRHLFRSRNS